MKKAAFVSSLFLIVLIGGCAIGDDGRPTRVGHTTYNVEDINAMRSRLFQRYGVWPRRYYSLFDGSNEAEKAFVAALPKVLQYEQERAVALGETFEIQAVELATNFITEGGFYVLTLNLTENINGFDLLGVDTLVDNYEALKPWLHESVRSAVEAGARAEARENEQGKTVHSLKELTFEEGFYANAGMFAWSKAQVAHDMAAKGIVLKDLEPSVQFFWCTVYYNAGSGAGPRLLNEEGLDWHLKKWTAPDDFYRFCRIARYNAMWRTATFEGLRQVVFSSPAGGGGGGGGTGGGGADGTARFPLTGPECGDIDYYGTCSGSLLQYCADEVLQQVQCSGPCAWIDSDIGFNCQPAEGAGCGRVTILGRCDQNVLSYCGPDGATLVTVDCAAEGGACSWIDEETGFDCAVPGQQGDCGGVDYRGTCEGATLRYCGQSGLESIDCAARGMNCAWQDESIGYNCLSGDGSCGDVTAQGECAGTVLRYCAGSEIITADCAAEGRVCSWRDVSIGYDCMDGDGSSSGEGCGDVDYLGRCDGDLLSYCSGSEVLTVDCAAAGSICGWESESVGYNCMASGDTPTCGSVTSQGECSGDLLAYCDGSGSLQQVDCASLGMSCLWQDAEIGYNCLPSSTPSCADGEFQCADGTCIPGSYVCDTIVDCAGGEDESGCLPDPGCGADQFECSDGACIPATYVCDTYIDCAGAEDEAGCLPDPGCEAGQFECADGTCIQGEYLCDGISDCPAGDDEEGCAPACSADQYTCNDGSCIPLSYACDGYDDCPSGEDEWYCA